MGHFENNLALIIIFLIMLTFTHLQDKMDGFVPAHLFGWWIKTLILRDYWLTFLLSILFEILEYSLQHQLPNFSECWWDHVSACCCHVLSNVLYSVITYFSLLFFEADFFFTHQNFFFMTEIHKKIKNLKKL